MKEYAVVYEWGPENWSAYVPDLPGCISTGKTIETVKDSIRDAIRLHLRGMRLDGDAVPEPTTRVEEILVDVV